MPSWSNFDSCGIVGKVPGWGDEQQRLTKMPACLHPHKKFPAKNCGSCCRRLPVRPLKVDLDSTAQSLYLVQTDGEKRDTLSAGLIINQFQEGTATANGTREQMSAWKFPL